MQGFRSDWSGLLGAGAQQANAMGQLGQQLGGQMRQKQAQEQQTAYNQSMQNDIGAALKSGNPMEIAQASIKYPEMAKTLRDSFKFASEDTEKNFKDTNFKILSDPENAPAYLQERISYLDSIGADSSKPRARLKMQQENPEQFLESTRGVTAGLYGKELLDWDKAMKGDEPEPMTQYQKENLQLQRDRLDQQNQGAKPTTAMQNFEQWQSLPEGKEKNAFAQQVGISPKDSPKAAQLKAEQADLLSTKVETAQDTIGTIDEILADDSLGEMVGLSSAFPTIPGGGVADLEAKVEQFRNQLTLENLDKMTGVLTDRDIQVLASAASGLETNMSEKAFKAQLNKIKNTLNRGINKNKSKLKTIEPQKQQDTLSDEDLINKYL